ncbi:type II secretion system F family protein [Xanthobacter sp. DSM 14520]|uniref:type II secretion system F family protein n=1 Tax=Xanthobacter autotrophicus (strain ATCC BAA-1158 / Py2) TaxID=78245 RepID=UPI003728B32A
MSGDLILPALFAGFAATSAVYAIFYGPIFGGGAAARRVRELKAKAPVSVLGSGVEAERLRRAMLASRLEEVDRLERDRKRLPLKVMLAQAGLTWTPRQFVLGSIGFGVGVFLLVTILTGNFLFGMLAGGGLGYMGPVKFVSFTRARRIRQFVKELPNALDAIVRGTRAGLHINECVRVIVREAQDPVRAEFRQVAEAQALGASLGDALERLSIRIPVEETRFLALAVAIQSAEGGGISEALSGLSSTMRDRIKLSDKISSMSAEARSGALLLAGLPFIGVGMNYSMDPVKTALLWSTTAGQLALLANSIWLAVGFFVMQKMQKVNT